MFVLVNNDGEVKTNTIQILANTSDRIGELWREAWENKEKKDENAKKISDEMETYRSLGRMLGLVAFTAALVVQSAEKGASKQDMSSVGHLFFLKIRDEILAGFKEEVEKLESSVSKKVGEHIDHIRLLHKLLDND